MIVPVAAARRSALAAVLLLVTALFHAPAPPARAAFSDACGPLIAKPGGGYWSCQFLDTFSGTALDSRKWVTVTTAANGFTHGSECYLASRSNVAVGGGSLALTVRREAAPFTCRSPRGDFVTSYSSGYVSTWGRFSQTYGRFAARIRFPATSVPGVHSAWWLWPVNPMKYGAWPASGEIDIAEYFSSFPDRVVPFVHYVGDDVDPHNTNNNCTLHRPDYWHTYVVEWTPRTITVKFDDKVCMVDDWRPTNGLTKPAPFDHPFFLNLTQALGIHGNKFDPATTPLPATMRVDWVRVWA